MDAFEQIIARNFTDGELIRATARQITLFASDAVDSLCEYVRSIGEARVNGGWNFS